MLRDQVVLELHVQCDRLREEVNHLSDLVADLQCFRIHLLYDNVRPGDVLAKAVKEFTLVLDFECSDAFFELINYTHGCEPGEGLYKNCLAVGAT